MFQTLTRSPFKRNLSCIFGMRYSQAVCIKMYAACFSKIKKHETY